ncbi:hypothetical protein [Sphingobium sp. Z007]|uniref:hypothetical protein n=1 Tax=Sphingobium sp. Z007 TaxID=627495 RepID=UPI001125032F|nr:hypothetical protein [Sphingobium sp. Z007]
MTGTMSPLDGKMGSRSEVGNGKPLIADANISIKIVEICPAKKKLRWNERPHGNPPISALIRPSMTTKGDL